MIEKSPAPFVEFHRAGTEAKKNVTFFTTCGIKAFLLYQMRHRKNLAPDFQEKGLCRFHKIRNDFFEKFYGPLWSL
jgi:hypothetical protein